MHQSKDVDWLGGEKHVHVCTPTYHITLLNLPNCIQLFYIVWRKHWQPTPVLMPQNPTNRGVWLAAVHGVTKSDTRLSDFTFPFPFHALEKEMATHSSVLAWRTPGTGEPGGLPSMGLHRVGHGWSYLAAAAAAAAAAAFHIVRSIMLPFWFAVVIIFYFLFGFWLWKLVNIFYYCEQVHCIMNGQQKIIEFYFTKIII